MQALCFSPAILTLTKLLFVKSKAVILSENQTLPAFKISSIPQKDRSLKVSVRIFSNKNCFLFYKKDVGGQGNSSSVKNNKHNESAGPFSSTKANTTTKQNQTSYQLPKMVMTPPKNKQIIISKGDEPCIAVSSNLLKKIEKIKVINKMDKTSMLGEYETMLGSMTKQIKQRQQSKNLSVEY